MTNRREFGRYNLPRFLVGVEPGIHQLPKKKKPRFQPEASVPKGGGGMMLVVVVFQPIRDYHLR